jgi:hypothetical protein
MEPKKPGHILILQAALDIANAQKPSPEQKLALIDNLRARTNELIPEEALPDICKAVRDAGVRLFTGKGSWVRDYCRFLHSQLGREGLEKLLEGTGHAVYDSPTKTDELIINRSDSVLNLFRPGNDESPIALVPQEGVFPTPFMEKPPTQRGN